ncbi:hypothetical protein [Shimia sp.]|uniref:hypothetical protein n=1 Tax=Shimia sp. TaxID=1954381 RepID=UPI003B8EA8FE
MNKSDRVILCMKWGSLYPSSYVNVLYSACQRHLEGDFRFVCLTPDTDGFAEGIEVFPIPDLGYGDQHWRSGAWPKLSVFLKNLYELQGRALFIDLDSLIVGDLAPFFEGEGFHAIGGGPDWRPGRTPVDPPLLTGVFAFDLGAHGHIPEAFTKDPVDAFDRCKLEQVFVQEHMPEWQAWPPEWVISFKRHLRRPIGVDRFLAPKEPEKSARIVAFHGDPRPVDVARKDAGAWGKFPRAGRGPIPWVRQYWVDNGFEG